MSTLAREHQSPSASAKITRDALHLRQSGDGGETKAGARRIPGVRAPAESEAQSKTWEATVGDCEQRAVHTRGRQQTYVTYLTYMTRETVVPSGTRVE